jgi:hypothetical protein
MRSGVSALLALITAASVLVALIISGLNAAHELKAPSRPASTRHGDSGTAHRPTGTIRTGTHP